MSNQYAIDYLPFIQRRGSEFTRQAVTRAEAEDAVMQLLVSGARILEIRCDGAVMPERQSDQLVKAAALRSVSAQLCVSLALDAAQLKARFGFAA